MYSVKLFTVSGHKYRQNPPTYNKAIFSAGEVLM
jgi:hypothetical protein